MTVLDHLTAGRRPIVVGVPAGQNADAELGYAAERAAREHRPILLVHAIPEHALDLEPEWPLVNAASLRLAGDQLLEIAAARVRLLSAGSVAISTSTRFGHPVDVLVGAGTSAALLVLQRRRLNRVRRALAGSVSAQVVSLAACPVVSVPEFWAPWPSNLPHVTVGIPRPTGNRTLLHRAFAEASRERVDLHVLHARDLHSVYDGGRLDPGAVRDWEHRVHASIRAEVDEVGRSHPGVHARVDVARHRPAEVLVAATRTALLLLLAHGDDARPGHLPAVTRAVLHDAHCPVEVLPSAHGSRAIPAQRASRRGVRV